jgi:nucleoside-diphosphate-sugar epimerase
MNIIFGGNGFIGKNLVLDGERPSKIDCDLFNLDSVIEYLSQFKNEKDLKIINLAAYVAGFTFNQNHNVEMLYNNSLIALNLMMALKKLKIKAYYLYTSSVCAYKDGNENEEFVFDDRPNKFNYGYGISKRLGISSTESLLLDNTNIKCGVLVPTNMYGEYDNFEEKTSHVIPNLIRKISKHPNKVDILGNVNNRRDFLYAGDFGKIISYFVNNEITGLYNCSTGKTISILELANLIKEILDFKGEFVYESLDEIQLRKTNNTKLLKILQNFNFTDIKEGLKNTIKYYELQMATK